MNVSAHADVFGVFLLEQVPFLLLCQYFLNLIKRADSIQKQQGFPPGNHICAHGFSHWIYPLCCRKLDEIWTSAISRGGCIWRKGSLGDKGNMDE